jgi:hypothetical protein
LRLGQTAQRIHVKMQSELCRHSYILQRTLVLSGPLDLPWVLLIARSASGLLRIRGSADDASTRQGPKGYGSMSRNKVIELKGAPTHDAWLVASVVCHAK